MLHRESRLAEGCPDFKRQIGMAAKK